MTYGQDHSQPGQYPRPGYGQQYGPQDQPWQQGYGQEYRPEDEQWQPQYDPRQHQRRTSGPQGAPLAAGPYPPRDTWQPRQPGQDYSRYQLSQRHRRKRSRTPLYAGVAAVIIIAGGIAYALAGHGSSPSPAPSASAATPASLLQLQKIVLQPADLPAGWKGTAYQPGPNDAAINAGIGQCVGARLTDSDQVAEAHSENFAHGEASISSSATSFLSQSDLAADIAVLRSPKLSSCLGQVIKKQLAASLAAGVTIEMASIKITPGSAGGAANVLATGTGTIKVRGNGHQISEYMTFAFIRGPLIEAEVDVDNVGAPVPASVVKPLVATVAARAAMG